LAHGLTRFLRDFPLSAAPGIQRLFNQGWSQNIPERLTMEDVQRLLREEINDNQDEEVGEVLDASRKSEMSARGGASE
jgi:hypothetical protein